MVYDLPMLEKLYAESKDVVDFAFVYVSEAHACDTWPLGLQPEVPSHKCIEDRVHCASEFHANRIRAHHPALARAPVYVDNFDNAFETVYATWPMRYYVILDGTIRYKSMPNPQSYRYDPQELFHVAKSLAADPGSKKEKHCSIM
eukprot:comp22187_c0_seq1/m.52257 comp22187_c0_seq1/g.52257  ORF comp22187_c0_seq1/g.52257 comp22187_c0_seq1/m.52257 type:complete len:145 (-) comp22187_c0_seq1:224-658(-)